jgi:hypothetical protein
MAGSCGGNGRFLGKTKVIDANTEQYYCEAEIRARILSVGALGNVPDN